METLLSSLRKHQALAQLVGESSAFLRAIRDLPAIARGDATVLITGETGTGKETVARAIHYLSSRARGLFVAVNCGSLTDQLFEEELFGHERGTFTDAHSQRSGLVVEARGGTLFLDEIDALARKSRVSILRLLQDKSFRAIGRGTEEHADTRILAATGESAIEHIANIPAMRLRAALERASQPMVKNIELDSSSVQGSNPLLRISGYNLTRGITPSVRIGGEQSR